VHYLILGAKGVHEPRLAAYMKQIAQGADFVEAGRQAFGDLKAFGREIESYVRGVQFFMKPVPTPNVPSEKTFETRPLAPAEALAIQAMLHAVTSRKTEARAEAEEAVRLDPRLGLGWRALARLELDDGRTDEAQKAAAEAVQVEPQSAVGHYLLGSVAWRGGDLPAAETELARAVEIDDALAVGQVRLAVLRNGLGRPNDEVIPHLRRGLALEPGNASFLVMLSGVLRDRGDVGNAQLLADRALQMVRTAEERAYVQETLAEFERTAARRAAARAAVGPAAGPDEAARQEAAAGPGAPAAPASPRPRAPARASDGPLTVTDAQAFRMFRASCEAGEPRGCDAAGDALLVGRGVTRDLALAAATYEKACEGGVARSCHQLAVLYATGQGVTRDPVKARTLFVKACKGGHEPACAHTGP
jgi:tetratricopeptide (TPR) repeat protein